MKIGWSSLIQPCVQDTDLLAARKKGVGSHLEKVTFCGVDDLCNLKATVLSNECLEISQCKDVDILLLFHIFQDMERMAIRWSSLHGMHLPHITPPSNDQQMVNTRLKKVKFVGVDGLFNLRGLVICSVKSLTVKHCKKDRLHDAVPCLQGR